MFGIPKPSIKGDEVIADLEVFAGGDDGCFPSDTVDDEPMANLFAPSLNCFHAESLKERPHFRIGFVPFPPNLFLVFVCHVSPVVEFDPAFTAIPFFAYFNTTCRLCVKSTNGAQFQWMGSHLVFLIALLSVQAKGDRPVLLCVDERQIDRSGCDCVNAF